MKLLFVLYIGFDKPGPSVHLLTDIIEQCLIREHDVTMIVRNRGGCDPDVPVRLQKYTNLNCKVIHDAQLEKSALVKRYFEDIRYAFRCRTVYKKLKGIEGVFLQSCTTPLFPMILLKNTLGCPILFNVQNIFPIDALALHKLSVYGVKGVAFHVLRRMQQMAYRRADRIVTICEDMRQTLLRERVPEDKLEVVYNWSYSDEAFDIADEENLFLKTYDVDKSKFRVVFAGNLGAMVNARLIAEAAEICQSEEKIQFFIIGDGYNMPVLKRLAEEKGLKNISFYPYQPVEYAPHNYAMAHVNINALPKGIVYTCMPSKTATMLNCARPMIVSVEKESFFARMLSEVDKCTIVDVDDAQELAQAILNNYYRNTVENSGNAREVFKEMCSREHARQYVGIMESMIESGARSGRG